MRARDRRVAAMRCRATASAIEAARTPGSLIRDFERTTSAVWRPVVSVARRRGSPQHTQVPASSATSSSPARDGRAASATVAEGRGNRASRRAARDGTLGAIVSHSSWSGGGEHFLRRRCSRNRRLPAWPLLQFSPPLPKGCRIHVYTCDVRTESSLCKLGHVGIAYLSLAHQNRTGCRAA